MTIIAIVLILSSTLMSCTNKRSYEQPYSFEDMLMLSTQQWEMNRDQEEYEKQIIDPNITDDLQKWLKVFLQPRYAKKESYMNYYDTFILVADDCPAAEGVVPAVKEGKPKPIHAIQYSLISENPYKLKQEDILFMVYAERNSISVNDTKARNQFFEKQQPCLRTSALPKKYGWGIHFDTEGKAALVGKSSKEYCHLFWQLIY